MPPIHPVPQRAFILAPARSLSGPHNTSTGQHQGRAYDESPSCLVWLCPRGASDHSNSIITSSTARLSPGPALILPKQPPSSRPAGCFPSSSPQPCKAPVLPAPHRLRRHSPSRSDPASGRAAFSTYQAAAFSGINARQFGLPWRADMHFEVRTSVTDAEPAADLADLQNQRRAIDAQHGQLVRPGSNCSRPAWRCHRQNARPNRHGPHRSVTGYGSRPAAKPPNPRPRDARDCPSGRKSRVRRISATRCIAAALAAIRRHVSPSRVTPLEPFGIFLGDKGRGHVARDKFRMIHHRRQETAGYARSLRFRNCRAPRASLRLRPRVSVPRCRAWRSSGRNTC